MQERLQTKLPMMTKTLHLKTEKEENTGGFNSIGPPLPSRPSQVSNLTRSTLTTYVGVAVLPHLSPKPHCQLYTSSYDCTIRSLSFVSGSSKEIYASEDGVLICSMDLPPTGNEMWISDGSGGVTHMDLRQDKSHIRRYELSESKIGCVSLNPTRPNFLLTASNSRFLK
jgi:hypothetical protein